MSADHNRMLQAVQAGFRGGRVLVLGDLMLDRYLWGEVARISPEAPVPVVRLERSSDVAGGAANVASNLAHLGVQVTLAGVVGADAARDRLLALVQEQGIDTGAVVATTGRPTTQKTRVLGGHQQMLRIDEEDVEEIDGETADVLLARVLERLGEVQAVVLSDYAKGVLSASCCQAVIEAAQEAGVPVLVDPKGREHAKYAHATAITPNLKELAAMTGRPARDVDALLEGGAQMCAELGLTCCVVTRGERGISRVSAGGIQHFPAVAREVFDVSGAGDTVIATLTAGVVAGLDWEEAISLANVAAGIVVGKVGTAPIRREELVRALQARQLSSQSSKIYSRDQVIEQAGAWQARGERIAFTNGCFDLIHAGHVAFLEQASREGRRLIVGLNTDRSVRELKGESRPIISQDDRARVLSSLACVDAVVVFDEETPLELIKAIRPSVLVKGEDYAGEFIAGAEEVKRWGGEVVLVPLVKGRSTTDIVGRVARMA